MESLPEFFNEEGTCVMGRLDVSGPAHTLMMISLCDNITGDIDGKTIQGVLKAYVSCDSSSKTLTDTRHYTMIKNS